MKRRTYTGGALIALAVAACSPPLSPAQTDAIKANLAAQTACVYEAGAGLADASAKRAAIDGCRCEASAQAGSPCPDSGVLP